MGCSIIAVKPNGEQVKMSGFSFSGYPEHEKSEFFRIASDRHHGIEVNDCESRLGDCRVQIEHVREPLVSLYSRLALVSDAYEKDPGMIEKLPEDTTIFYTY